MYLKTLWKRDSKDVTRWVDIVDMCEDWDIVRSFCSALGGEALTNLAEGKSEVPLLVFAWTCCLVLC
jgi:hypothetical protein